ncbi:methyltransferase domain-containing protein [Nocardiopsis ansamitocini]|uniref:Protein-L-isoaspartate O-methyltransferase n=1 Tax=Nocardiopsis ansamitocini TaxID=1670832 RepID=A0A9W6P5M8_9ACTN|nr:methyltransferase domain-containing protein [Nocardiopsis ansamitocini]GLU47591.1 protein-L-isoaspartate O-methyltransferase [Nocardiopsis ansamitocini]
MTVDPPQGPDSLVRLLESLGALGDPAWRAAFAAVPRHRFIPDVIWPRDAQDPAWRAPLSSDSPQWRSWVYSDYALITQVDDGEPAGGDGRGRYPTSSASQPSLMARMLDALTVSGGESVLEIGTATGFNCALLCHRLGSGRVASVEIDPALAEQGRANLAALGYRPHLVVGDGSKGVPERAPFDRVVATVAAREIPWAWVEQTRPGGVVVTPWATSYYAAGLLRLDVGDGGACGRFLGDAPFMLLRGQRSAKGGLWDFVDERAPGVEPYRAVFDPSPLALDDTGLDLAVGVLVPGLAYYRFDAKDGSGEASVYAYDRAGSWGLIEYEPNASEYEAYRFGRRDLWAEVAHACSWWNDAGRPGRDRFGVTVTAAGQRVWLDEPGNVVA